MTKLEIVLDERTGTRTVTVEANANNPRAAALELRRQLDSGDTHVLVGEATLINPMKVSEVRPASKGGIE